ncbi:unnamed protein product [Vicia faba]|uniref:Uncharacterized protein n=1 Tax=Vicia faba TaxID=3906 RepID=A0AAV1B9I3_VICFA|nr:unnamed protein product [Vicia faba]
MNLPPHIIYQMEEFSTVIFDRIQSLVVERLIASDHIAYGYKWDTLRTFVDIKLRVHLKNVATSKVEMGTHIQSVVPKKEEIYVQMKTLDAKQDEMGSDLKAILENLKQKL